ncbi:MAG: hypothetical protein JRI34_05155 [Deltaproteobacteria bacterium]|nr:hypothetical protein [Deltaproteobacteria bacterium]
MANNRFEAKEKPNPTGKPKRIYALTLDQADEFQRTFKALEGVMILLCESSEFEMAGDILHPLVLSLAEINKALSRRAEVRNA